MRTVVAPIALFARMVNSALQLQQFQLSVQPTATVVMVQVSQPSVRHYPRHIQIQAPWLIVCVKAVTGCQGVCVLPVILEHIHIKGQLSRVQTVPFTALHLPLGQYPLQIVSALVGMSVMLQLPYCRLSPALSEAAMGMCVLLMFQALILQIYTSLVML